jgi:putative glycosyltransferase (TIGR04372 family)
MMPDHVLAAEIPSGESIPMDWFDTHAGSQFQAPAGLVERGIATADLMLTPNQLRGNILAGLPKLALFTPPDSSFECGDWHAVIHYRMPNAPGRPASAMRDCDPADYQAVADYIRSLGGAVVRVGHPDMGDFDYDVDLSEADFDLQVKAMATARFMVGGPSGPVNLASLMGVPCIAVSPQGVGAVFTERDLVVPLEFYEGGRRLSRIAIDGQNLTGNVLAAEFSAKHETRHASVSDICAAVDVMMARDGRDVLREYKCDLRLPLCDTPAVWDRAQWLWGDATADTFEAAKTDAAAAA